MGNQFANLITTYPVSPYLDNNTTFSKWTHFIHNKINEQQGKRVISYDEFMTSFKLKFTPHEKNKFNKKLHGNILYGCILVLLLFCIYFALNQ